MLPRHSTGYSECSAIGWMTLLGNIPTKLEKKNNININETENKRNKILKYNSQKRYNNALQQKKTHLIIPFSDPVIILSSSS